MYAVTTSTSNLSEYSTTISTPASNHSENYTTTSTNRIESSSAVSEPTLSNLVIVDDDLQLDEPNSTCHVRTAPL